MLSAAVSLLALALMLGAAAALLWLSRGGKVPAPLAAVHAGAAVAGFALLAAALPGETRGAASGTQSFGAISAALIAASLVAGLAMLMLRWKRRAMPGGLLGLHATLAVSGFVILAVYAWLK